MKPILHGVVLLDKPQGITSFSAIRQLAHAYMGDFNSKKVGHTGTLDPMATGLLCICFGQATKFANFGLDAPKSYDATIALGAQTDSGDIDGQIIKKSPIRPFCQKDLDAIANNLLGRQMQTPPIYSALKKDGKKLYEYARAGVDIDIPPRPIYIHALDLHAIDERHIAMHVRCSKGTYVRTLGETVAQTLDMLGTLCALRRTQAGGFSIDMAHCLGDFADSAIRQQALLSADTLCTHLPNLALDTPYVARLQMGQRLNLHAVHSGASDFLAKHFFDNPQYVYARLYSDTKYIGVVRIEPCGRISPHTLIR